MVITSSASYMRCVKDLLGDFKEQCMAESFSHAYVF